MQTVEYSPLIQFCQKSWRAYRRLLIRAGRSNRFLRVYAVFALLVLLGTTAVWSYAGAKLHMHNADQLSDPYMFESWHTFNGAQFPGAHTFLLKWPLFALLGAIGITPTVLISATVALCVAVVAVLAALLYRVDRRPLNFAVTCLVLSLVLLLVPTQPYAGALLPVNMAMLTTRNVEYLFYIAALICYVKATRIRSRYFVAGTVLLGLLIASDKLFLSLSGGAALLVLLAYAIRSNWTLASFGARWFMGTGLAYIGASVLLVIIQATHLTNLVNSGSANPYGFTTDKTGVLLGSAYSVLGLLTNTGANPAFDAIVLGDIPRKALERLTTPYGWTYIVAAACVLYALLQVWRLLRPTFRSAPRKLGLPVANTLSLMLIFSTLVALAIYVGTQHYYAVDARYVTIGFFALIFTVVTRLRRVHWRWRGDVLLVTNGLCLAIAVALYGSWHIARQQMSALQPIADRNARIVTLLQKHHNPLLVGDYWRVLPVRAQDRGVQAMPMASCLQPSQVLTSNAWQPSLVKRPFAYLLTLDRTTLTGFPACSLEQVTTQYGRPNHVEIVAGTAQKPAEALLFYDHGIRKPKQGKKPLPNTSLADIKNEVGVEDLTDTTCPMTTMNIVAHEDDDILFLSPDLLHDIQSGACVRTVYLTAGDAGQKPLYWQGRQLGAQAAYDTMLGQKAGWKTQTLTLNTNQNITLLTPQANPRISLLFFNLPDGNIHGQGFGATGHQTLDKLQTGQIATLQSIGGKPAAYTKGTLLESLVTLMTLYQPTRLHTQADVDAHIYPDHSDHRATSRLASEAAQLYSQQYLGYPMPIRYYLGYSIHEYAPNISGADLEQKEAAFMAYSRHDNGVCHSLAECDHASTYGAYVKRQYTTEDLGL